MKRLIGLMILLMFMAGVFLFASASGTNASGLRMSQNSSTMRGDPIQLNQVRKHHRRYYRRTKNYKHRHYYRRYQRRPHRLMGGNGGKEV